jgi:hypothetical protein
MSHGAAIGLNVLWFVSMFGFMWLGATLVGSGEDSPYCADCEYWDDSEDVKCEQCDGLGWLKHPTRDCPGCDGIGWIEVMGPKGPYKDGKPCPQCGKRNRTPKSIFRLAGAIISWVGLILLLMWQLLATNFDSF